MLALLLACTQSSTPTRLTEDSFSEITHPHAPTVDGDTLEEDDTAVVEPEADPGSADADILIAVMLDTYRGDWMIQEGFDEPLQTRLESDGWSLYPASTLSNWTWPSIRLLSTGCGFFSNLEDPDADCEDFTLFEHGGQQVGDMTLLPSLVDAQVLVLSNSPLWRASHSDICQGYIDQGGICEVQEGPLGKDNERLVDRALELRGVLSQARADRGKVVLFLHILGPHATYDHYPEYGDCTLDTTRLPAGWEDFDPTAGDPLPELLTQAYSDEGMESYGPAQQELLAYYQCVYETDMAHTNAQVARLLEGFDADWMTGNRAMMMLYNDHGERFGEPHPEAAIPENGIFATEHGKAQVYENVTGGFGGLWIPWWGHVLPAAEDVPRLSAEDLWQTAFYHLGTAAPERLGGDVIGTTPVDTPAWSAAADSESRIGSVRAVWHTDAGSHSLVCTLTWPQQSRCEGYDSLEEHNDLLEGSRPWLDDRFSAVWPQMRTRLESIATRLDWQGTLPE
jgi:hypothetical protein